MNNHTQAGTSPRTTGLLDLARIATGELHSDPFPWARIENVFASPTIAEELQRGLSNAAGVLDFYPDGGARDVVHGTFENRSFIEGGKITEAGLALTGVWRTLLDTLMDEEYRAALGRLARQDLTGCLFKVRLTRSSHNYWLDPHIDSASTRYVTHIFYWNSPWRDDWGGHLRILRSADSHDVVARIPPLLNSSSVIVGTDTSWHALERLSDEAPSDRFRLMVIVHPPDFRSRAIEAVRAGVGPTVEVARAFGILEDLLNEWTIDTDSGNSLNARHR